MGRIILARAGTTDFDEQHRITGTLDIPVNLRGQAELSELAQSLRDQPIEMIYCAAGEASKESARFLGEHLGIRVKVLEGLYNHDLGLWQGLEVGELRRKHPRVYRQWEETPCAICPPQGETVEEVLNRVQKGLRPVVRRSQRGTVLLVAPDPLRLVIRCHLRKVDLSQLWQHGNGAIWETIEVE